MVTPLFQSGAVQNQASDVPVSPGTLLKAVTVLLLAYLLARLTSYLLTTAADRLATHRFRVTLLVPIAKLAIYGAGAWVVIRLLFDLSTTQLVAFSGLLGAAPGLGLKDLVADLLGGLVLVAEQPYQIGDKVSIDDYYGEVVDIGVRSTTLVTPGDTLVTVPNYLFFDESIANANAGNAEMLVTVEFFVDPETDVEHAREIVEEALITSPYVYVTDDLPAEVLVEDDLYYRTLTGRAYVTDLRKELHFRSDVTRRVLDRFSEAGIRSPKVPAGVDDASREPSTQN